MPALQPPALILVTGANGYIAAWIIHNLLSKGFSVRATVRSEDKGKHFKELEWSKKYVEEGKLEVVVVSDISKEGAFDEAVKGVDGIAHTASPVNLNADDPQELIGPAVGGTLSVLNGALKYGSSVKRIIITGSCAAVVSTQPTPKVFNEDDWNEQSIRMVNEQGKNVLPLFKYRASKTLAEKAAWEHYERNKGSVGWDMAVLLPPYVFGPTLQPVTKPTDLGTSAAEFYNILKVEGYKTIDALRSVGSWVDVRDLAEAHVRALTKEEAGGNRIIVNAGAFLLQEWLDIANSLPTLPSSPVKGYPLDGTKPVYSVQFDSSKAAKILHLGNGDDPEGVSGWYKLRTMEEEIRDVMEEYAQKGW